MNYKQKYSFLLLFLVIGVIFTACEKDDAYTISEENILKDFPFTSKLLTKGEYQNNRKLVERLYSLVPEKENSLDFTKDHYDAQNDITIHTDKAIYIEYADGTLHSYTFSVRRSNSVENIIENIVFTYSPSDDTYEANSITYHLSAEQKQAFIETGHLTGNYTISDASIDLDFSVVAPKNSLPLPCTTNFTVYHLTPDTNETFVYSSTNGNIQNTCEHENDDEQCYEYLVVSYDCPDGGSAGPSSSTGNPTAGGGGNNNTSNNDPPSDPNVVTQPLVNINEQNDLNELREISETPIIKTRLDDFRNRVSTDTLERASEFRTRADDSYYEHQISQDSLEFSGTRFPIPLVN
ncbi:MAG: hypothetical protein AAF617_04650 [Bacteroidota bacterium]